MLTFDDVVETNPPAARAVRALSAVLPPKLVAVRSMILPDVEASIMVGVQLCVFFFALIRKRRVFCGYFSFFFRLDVFDWLVIKAEGSGSTRPIFLMLKMMRLR